MKKQEEHVGMEEFLAFLKLLPREKKERIAAFLREEIKPQYTIPVTVIATDTLSSLEAIVKYLKEVYMLSFIEIARLLNRDKRTIWTTYHNAKAKMRKRFRTHTSKTEIPVSLFTDRQISVLEHIVEYLKTECKMTNREVARALNKNYRTILSVHRRYVQKNNNL